MTHTDQQHAVHADEQALAQRAGEGDTIAFDELCRRHLATAWNLAYAVTLSAADARSALAEGVGQAFTAQRAGRIDPDEPFHTLLLARTHDAALDRSRAHTGGPRGLPDAGGDPHLATAFSDLPDRWRGPLWLHVADEVDAATVATVTGLTPNDVTALLTRARAGLVERYLHTPALGVPARNCRRAVARLGSHMAGTLPAGDREKLERHLSLCPSCTAAHARLATLDAALPLLAVPIPDDVGEPVRAAWTAAVATRSTTSGMSARAEKVLACVSAFAAVVGVLGAALYAIQDDDDSTPIATAPIAPLVEQVATPPTFDLSGGIALPVANRSDATAAGPGPTTDAIEAAEVAAATSEPVPSAPRIDSSLHTTGPDEPTSPLPESPLDDVTEPIEQLTDEVPVPDGILPEADVSLEIADQPIEIDVDEDPNLTVGPVSTGSDDATNDENATDDRDAGDGDAADDEPIEVGGSLEPAEPVVEVVNDTVGSTQGTLGL